MKRSNTETANALVILGSSVISAVIYLLAHI